MGALDMSDQTQNVLPHIDDGVQAITAVHAEHYQKAAPLQGSEPNDRGIGRPEFWSS